LQPIDVQKSVNKPTVGAIHELPLLPQDENRYKIKSIIDYPESDNDQPEN